ncbi:MAG: glycoside hydrolase family 15 protein [Candidatus Aramenus sp.]|jgi:GH15 family glucan-1,4-alpha-glucosidase|nr:glycoside hydrolase family 15 protein [Candidatus Aramenus sp.]
MVHFYAFLSNGLTSALENDGSIDWFPCPRFDSPSVFTKLLDREGGHFAVRPLVEYVYRKEYLRDSLILESEFKVKDGKRLRLVDFLPLSLPGIIRIYESEIPFYAEVKPSFSYGLIKPGVEVREAGLIFKNPTSKEGVEVLVHGDFQIEGDRILFNPGKGYLYLLYSKDLRYGLFSQKGFVYSKPYEALERALKYWRGQLEKARKTKTFEEEFKRSLLVLLGLIYTPSGGIIASPTTSLPEIVRKERNWDYRYVWVRDASYSAEALIKAGLALRGRDILSFLTSMIDPSSKSFDHPFYSVDGTAPPAEEEVPWLEGYKGSRPVRIGNGAYLQVQSDIEGAYLHALYEYYRATGDKEFVRDVWWAIEAIANWVKNSWKEKSTDIWEQRGVYEHFVHTKVMDWVAMDRAYKLAEEVGVGRVEWKEVAEEIREDVLANGYSERKKSFVRYYGSEEVDAALLTLPLYGFVDARDPRFLSTLERIEKELSVSKGLLLRYREDFIGEVVNPFTLVSTWLARVYVRLGKIEEAVETLKRLVECSTDLKLMAEHYERGTCEPMGNFPHVFPHSGLIMAVTEIEEMGNGNYG